MRKILIMLMLSASMACYAYEGVARLFTEESGDMFSSLSFSARYQMVNNYSSVEKSEVLNNLQTTESRILKLEYDYMKVATSAGKTVELKLVPQVKNDTVLAVIETVATPVKDSKLSFYDLKWNRLETSRFIKIPQLADFFMPKAPKASCEELERLVNFAMIEMTFDGDDLVARCNLEDFYLGNDFKHYKSLVINRIVYTLKKGKFEKK